MIGPAFPEFQEDYPQPVKAPAMRRTCCSSWSTISASGSPVRSEALSRLPTSTSSRRKACSYNEFNTTALCSPTRAALLTGRNHHQVGTGAITELSTGYPGYNGVWGKNVASVAEVLRQNGYATGAFGKWHNTPDWRDQSDRSVRPLADRIGL